MEFQEPQKTYKKPNSWMIDPVFISRIIYKKDKQYLETLLGHLSKFIDKLPIAVICTWDYKHECIYFTVGHDNKNFVKVDPDISYFDFITLCDRWLRQFYPKYDCEVVEEVKYTDNEISEMISEGKIDIESDLSKLRKKISYKEKAIIQRAFILSDNFKMNVNGESFIRHSKIPISVFLKELRKLREATDTEKRDYILSNSLLLSKIENQKEILVDYDHKRMVNFFKINVEDNFDKEVQSYEDDSGIEWIKWGRFRFQLASNEVSRVFFHMLETHKMNLTKMKQKEEINGNRH
jgi:hypothetical protein